MLKLIHFIKLTGSFVPAVGSRHHDVPAAFWPSSLLGRAVGSIAICCHVCHSQQGGKVMLGTAGLLL